MTFFPEYLSKTSSGLEVMPQRYAGKWYIGNIQVTFKEMAIICRLSEEDATFLALSYGIL